MTFTQLQSKWNAFKFSTVFQCISLLEITDFSCIVTFNWVQDLWNYHFLLPIVVPFYFFYQVKSQTLNDKRKLFEIQEEKFKPVWLPIKFEKKISQYCQVKFVHNYAQSENCSQLRTEHSTYFPFMIYTSQITLPIET